MNKRELLDYILEHSDSCETLVSQLLKFLSQEQLEQFIKVYEL